MPKTQSRQLLVAGFDPGGRGNFGWCITRCAPWEIIDAGRANNADDALDRVLKKGAHLAAAGIDAPLYWSCDGLSRKSDFYVRRQMTKARAQNPSGTVQAVNSLRGACLAQGVMLALAIEKQFPDCMITETHPKALFACEARLQNCRWSESRTEHERDAKISAWAAAQAISERQGWQDLFALEKDKCIHPFLKKTHYWWPKE